MMRYNQGMAWCSTGQHQIKISELHSGKNGVLLCPSHGKRVRVRPNSKCRNSIKNQREKRVKEITN